MKNIFNLKRFKILLYYVIFVKPPGISIINTHKMQFFLQTKNTRDLEANGRVLSEIKLKDTKRLDLH